MAIDAMNANWNYPTAIRFGAGRIKELPQACRALAMNNPLLVTDPGIAELPMIRDALASCRAEGLGCGLFSGVQANPVGANVDAGVSVFRQEKHDGVIAFGGGSALDAGKAIALMAGQDRPLWDFEDREDWYTRVDVAGMAPVVAIPTTSGTGSEVGRASVITDEQNHTKKIIFHPNMLPGLVLADPELTLGLPRNITAWVGMDALSHNLEAWSSPFHHPMAHGISIEGMKLIRRWLPRAVADGSDLEARAKMMVASTMGATAFQKGLGAMHALSHPCGAVHNTQHGLTNAVVMPYVLVANRSAIESQLPALCCYLGIEDASFAGFLDWVLALRQELDIPHTLADIGIDTGDVDQLAPMAETDPSMGTNPIILNAASCAELYRDAIAGVI